MFFHAKNGVVPFPDGEMDYLRFGTGKKVLIMLPGLGDGLRSVKGMALPMAVLYRMFAKDFTVYAFSRKNSMPAGCSTRDMAEHVVQAMDMLGIEKAHLFGISMGGMIAQHLAADHPEKVEKLVLTVTSARPNPVLEEAIGEWISQAKAGDHTALMDSNLRRIYSEGYYRRNKWMVPLVGRLTRPKSYDRFLVMAQACLDHNGVEKLPAITAPTLVVGGEQDNCLGGEASREIAAAIPGAKLRMFPQWGHGLYEEAPEFNGEVLAFLRDNG
ncbi:MAG: alpha/beta fold hydrolase [Oscillospiraceae bacterium]|nr:alpha/beta fold hydrolase [Oscillospiraceae bacterium]